MPKPWPDDVREQAVRLAVEQGLPEASRATGVPRPTIHGWLTARGLSAWSEQSDREKTAAARTAAEQSMERWRAGRRQLLSEVSLRGLRATAARLTDPDREDLPAIIGAWTRAEHHLERMERVVVGDPLPAQVVVEFNVGRTGRPVPSVVTEAQLGGTR